MTDITQSFSTAWKHLQAGDVRQAESEYRKILAAQPNHADARHLLGVALHQSGRNAEAIDEIARAIELDRSNATFHDHLGVVYGAAGHALEAEQSFRAALALNPRDPQIHFNLAALLGKQQNTAAAIEHYREALRLRPDFAQAHFNLGNLLQGQDQLAQAAEHYRLAVQANPRYIKAWSNLGSLARQQQRYEEAAECFRRVLDLDAQHVEARYGLGSVLHSQGRHEESLEHLRRVLELKPDHAEAHNNLGCALLALGRLDEAVESLRHAVAARPDFAAMFNMGCALATEGNYREAEGYFRSLTTSEPDSPDPHFRLGRCLQFEGDFLAAAACYDRAIALKPTDAEFHYYRATTRLAAGDFWRGWPEYEWRLKTRFALHNYPQPQWRGEELRGQGIVVQAEGGMGDTLHFVRYLPWIEARGGDVHLAVQPGLIPLLVQSGFKQVIEWQFDPLPLPQCQWQVLMLSLPGIFNTVLENIPAHVPYLHADPTLVERWRTVVERFSGFRVGICWQGNPGKLEDRYRSIPLVEFAPIAKVTGVQLISLQRIHGMGQLDQLRGLFDVAVVADDPGTAAGAWMDSAAIVRNLDLVITCDTATAHLAGALGVPVWVAVPRSPDWRWFLDRDDSPWYPTMRLFRQTRLGDWRDVFKRIAAELQSMLEANLQPR